MQEKRKGHVACIEEMKTECECINLRHENVFQEAECRMVLTLFNVE